MHTYTHTSTQNFYVILPKIIVYREFIIIWINYLSIKTSWKCGLEDASTSEIAWWSETHPDMEEAHDSNNSSKTFSSSLNESWEKNQEINWNT